MWDDKNEFHSKPSGTTDKSYVITITHSRMHSHTFKCNNKKATPPNRVYLLMACNDLLRLRYGNESFPRCVDRFRKYIIHWKRLTQREIKFKADENTLFSYLAPSKALGCNQLLKFTRNLISIEFSQIRSSSHLNRLKFHSFPHQFRYDMSLTWRKTKIVENVLNFLNS